MPLHLIIRSERIVAVGSDAEARRFVGPGTGRRCDRAALVHLGRRLIVLDRDPLTVPATELVETRVLAVLVGGERVREDAVLGWPERRKP